LEAIEAEEVLVPIAAWREESNEIYFSPVDTTRDLKVNFIFYLFIGAGENC
jgi:hypothetical protein